MWWQSTALRLQLNTDVMGVAQIIREKCVYLCTIFFNVVNASYVQDAIGRIVERRGVLLTLDTPMADLMSLVGKIKDG